MKLGLALGGGGARGGAHIGVLKELDAIGLKPDLVTGTSVGGLVGALLCADFTLEEIETIMKSLKPGVLYSLPQDDRSFGSPEKVESKLTEIFAKHYQNRFKRRPTFADLSIPLALVATDLVTRREVVLDEGDLIKAIMATISIPILFPPVQYGERQLVDGGLMNNVPFDVARARGATYTIAVDLGNSLPYGTEIEHPFPNKDVNFFEQGLAGVINGQWFEQALYQATRSQVWQVVTAVIDIVNQQNVQLRLAISPPDVLIRPSVGTIGLLDFHTIDEGIEAGQQAFQRAAPQIERLLTMIAQTKEEDVKQLKK